jgi:hypothetical protein
VKIYYKGSIAMERLLRDTAKRLKFAIQFAAMDLDSMRPGDWLNLKDDLAAFLGLTRGKPRGISARGAVQVIHKGKPDPDEYAKDDFRCPDEYTEDDFRLLQQETNVLLQSLVWEGGLSADYLKIQAELGILTLLGMEGAYVHVARGATRDMFLLSLWLLIREEGVDRIRRCPECNKMFYRVAKQQYCTRACTNRANVRAWRQREEAGKSASDQPS